jgi:hypothetical protein
MHELTSPQVEQELREETELLRKFKAGGVILFVFSKSRYEFYQKSIEPSDDVHRLLSSCAEHCLSGHQHRSCFLIKPVGNLSQVFSGRHHSLNCCHSEPFLSVGVLVCSLELQVYFCCSSFRFSADNIEVNCERL